MAFQLGWGGGGLGQAPTWLGLRNRPGFQYLDGKWFSKKNYMEKAFTIFWIRDVEAIKFLMLPLPAPLEILYFRVRFRFLIFGIFCFRFRLRIELAASEFASASGLFHQSASASTKFNRFHIPAHYETANWDLE